MKKLFLAIVFVFVANWGYSQFYAVRTNALALLTGSINVGLEAAVSQHSSFDLAVYYNPINSASYKSQGFAIMPAYKYWFAKTYTAGYFTINATYMDYDFGGKEDHSKGTMIGGGLSYGYHFVRTRRMNIGLEIGAGCYSLEYDKEKNEVSYEEDEYIYHKKKTSILPSRCEVSIVYLF